jgi:SAM-dependent methyltransferase
MSLNLYDRILAHIDFDAEDSFLAVCAGEYDKEALQRSGATRVVISNVEPHAGVTDYAPFAWEYQDAENLTVDDKSFDWCIVQAGLHHCASPHRALCEMLRVARKGVIVIEARDSMLIKAAVMLGLTPDYELEPALLSNGQYGGYRNTKIPNYIYRWTEREVRKTVNSMLPYVETDIFFFYRLALPLQRLAMSKSITKKMIAKMAIPFVPVLERLFKRQVNQFGFVIRVDRPSKPWILISGRELGVDLEFIKKKYDASKYRSR